MGWGGSGWRYISDHWYLWHMAEHGAGGNRWFRCCFGFKDFLTMSITLTSAINPRWADAAHTGILLDCTFEHLGDGVVPFNARPDDPEAHGRDIYVRAAGGEFGAVQDHLLNPFNADQS